MNPVWDLGRLHVCVASYQSLPNFLWCNDRKKDGGLGMRICCMYTEVPIQLNIPIWQGKKTRRRRSQVHYQFYYMNGTGVVHTFTLLTCHFLLALNVFSLETSRRAIGQLFSPTWTRVLIHGWRRALAAVIRNSGDFWSRAEMKSLASCETWSNCSL